MRTLYEASNGIEAHMILDLLQQAGLSGRVDGEYLQGGIGELPAAGLVRVMVEEQDYEAAKRIVDQWDAAQPAVVSTSASSRTGNRFAIFAMGLVVGIACAYGYYQAPVYTDGVDHNHDGILDDKWTYSPSGRPIKNEVDRNFDGKVDYVAYYGSNGVIESADLDDNFDGIFETKTTYRLGNPYLIETDTDGDGYRDFKTNLVNGVVVSNEYIYPKTGLPQKIDYFKLGKLTHSETDADKDGKMDKRTVFNELCEIVSVESIK